MGNIGQNQGRHSGSQGLDCRAESQKEKDRVVFDEKLENGEIRRQQAIV